MNPPRSTTGVLLLKILALVMLAAPQAKAQYWPVVLPETTTSNVLPFYLVGKFTVHYPSYGVDFDASGVTIKTFSALTAAHCIYDPQYGWIQGAEFEVAKTGATSRSLNKMIRDYVIAGYTKNAGSFDGTNSSYGFSYDSGAFVCSTRPNGGGYSAWSERTTLLTGSNYKMSLGYGEEFHDGESLLRSAPSRPRYSDEYGAFFTNGTYQIEEGMSGGPVFAYNKGWWYVVAINVAGDSHGTGVRAIDSQIATIIRKKLF